MRRALVALMLVMLAASARAEVLSLEVGGEVDPPPGWITFCQGFSAQCTAPPTQPRSITYSSAVWTVMRRINAKVNNMVKPKTDLEHWGVSERWGYPDDGFGDCEDYVLEKKRQLVRAGLPPEALLITVVKDTDGNGHAVLTVPTNKGDFILDNKNRMIVLWHETPYKFRKRQSQYHPNMWVSLADPRHPLFTGGH